MKIISLTFNPFAENTLLMVGQKGSCIIIDPGMMDAQEMDHLEHTIQNEGATPLRLLLTHCHIDHVLGIKAVYDRYGLEPECHAEGLPLLEACPQIAKMYAIPYTEGPMPTNYLADSGTLELDGEEVEWRYVPGHAPGHVVFIHHPSKQVIGGDTLFQSSIGRTDLPGGDHELLLRKIREELFSLDDEYVVWPGHGPRTTIGVEKRSNPFLR
ncbi:MAG: MBL fold metallo-hydrolase [Flavobacteriales bacterium]|nr:MBL fold metallo-hydrolase [Flavobacteriales bacterium]